MFRVHAKFMMQGLYGLYGLYIRLLVSGED